jgi:hypothetical protein
MSSTSSRRLFESSSLILAPSSRRESTDEDGEVFAIGLVLSVAGDAGELVTSSGVQGLSSVVSD